MNFMTLLTPLLLFVHNPIDFRNEGAGESYVNFLNCVFNEYIGMLENNNDIHLVNKTADLDDRFIHSFRLRFESYAQIDLDTARKMMLQLIDSFVIVMNSNSRLKPFLCPCPFTSDQLEIRLNFLNDCLYPYPQLGTVKYMIFKNGAITFYAENPRSLGKLEKMREEPLDFSRLAENLPYPPGDIPQSFDPCAFGFGL
jgi:hypothetical protein